MMLGDCLIDTGDETVMFVGELWILNCNLQELVLDCSLNKKVASLSDLSIVSF